MNAVERNMVVNLRHKNEAMLRALKRILELVESTRVGESPPDVGEIYHVARKALKEAEDHY